jgi:hypothetical protein
MPHMARLRITARKALAFPLAILLSALLAVGVSAAAAHAQGTGQWQFTGSMANGHSNWYNGGFAQLPDGRVLAISGVTVGNAFTPTAEIYDPQTGQWSPAGTLTDARYAFGPPSVLANGDVLVAGGHDPNVVDYATAELYDPSTNRWTPTGGLNRARRYPVQVELANGEVLVATGSYGPPTCTRYLSSSELYNPATGQWSYTGSTLVPRESANAIRLADGRVLLAGGYNGGGGACTDTGPVDTETYDPSTGQWSFAGNLPHGWLGGAMVLLPDGRVLMVDGNEPRSGAFAEAVLFDPTTGQWSEAAPPLLPRSSAAATLLPDGKVLVSQGGQVQSEIYDPATNTWSLDASALDTNGSGHTFLLPNGQVLLAGGANSAGPSTTAELYTSASGGSQTIGFTGPGSGTYGGSATLTAAGGGSGNPVVFTVDPSSTTGACTASGTNGSTVTYTGPGDCVIDADQAGGNGYPPAPEVRQTITVSPAPLTITASSPTMTYGGQPPVITPAYSGFVAGDGPASLTTPPTCSTTATSASPLGSFQSSFCTGASDPDYQISVVPGLVTVTLGNYVSMGDSFSSGEGNGGYIDGSNTPTDKCHRSSLSYPVLMVNADPLSLADSPKYAACSGAYTYDFLHPNHRYPATEPSQVTGLNANTNVVTFTIGGNDIGFGGGKTSGIAGESILQNCIRLDIPAVYHHSGYRCSEDAVFAALINRRIEALDGQATAKDPDGNPIISIQTLLQTIHADAPQAAIFVAGYPRLFGSSVTDFQPDKHAPSKYVCTVGSVLTEPATIDYADAQWLNSKADALDSAIATAVSDAQAAGVPVTYVGTVPSLFKSHGLCDSGSPWFYPLTADLTIPPPPGGRLLTPDPGSFHPTQDGQQYGYEVAFSGGNTPGS